MVELVNSLSSHMYKCLSQPLFTLYPINAIIPHQIPAALLAFYADPSRFCAASCSLICFVQYLEGANLSGCFKMRQHYAISHPNILRIPNSQLTYLGHLVSVLSVCADAPRHSCDSNDDTEHNGSVCAPVLGLSVPTTGRRPDVLGVPVVAMSSAIDPCDPANSVFLHVRDLGATAHECLCGLHCGDVVYCAGICQSPGRISVPRQVRLEVEVRARECWLVRC